MGSCRVLEQQGTVICWHPAEDGAGLPWGVDGGSMSACGGQG